MASTRQSRRLIQLRKDNNLLQSDLARMISELSHRKEGISVPAISSWETGRRTPSLEMINILSSIYQVTPEYIQCLTDDPQGTAYLSKDEAEQILENQHKVEVDLRDIDMFDGKPVFIIFENLVHEDQWAIVNSKIKSFICKNGIIKYSEPTVKKVFINEPFYTVLASNENKTPMSMSTLLNSKGPIWIEVTTSDTYIQGQYNGWYRHNENRTCLINKLGLTLPYEGLSVSYNAFVRRKMQ